MIYDVIVVGAGGAGLVSAIKAKESGANVLVITKEYPTRSQTSMAQGGINAAFGYAGEDSVESHMQNTLKSAHNLAEKSAVEFLCKNAIESVKWLDSIGVPFSRTSNNTIAQRRLGGASAPRACYAQDYTGLKILHTLYDRANALDIEIRSEKYLLEILTSNSSKNEKQVCGISVLNKRNSEIERYMARSVIIATGGYGRVYGKHSTNSVNSTGDGIIAALKAGAKVADLEFIQFHPTALKNSSILVSESARGAGGYLLNSRGKRFTDELLPRDEVARAIDDEIKKGEDIFLDIRHLGEEFIDEELPQERKLAKLYENIDPVNSPIPIKPAAHYTMGGILVDADSMSSISGLFAVGECANHKVHGANRLGGNSLLELVVFGLDVGKNAADFAKKVKVKEIDSNISEYIEKIFKKPTPEINFYQQMEYLSDLMYENVSIKRDESSLLKALNEIQNIKNLTSKMGIDDKSKIYNSNLVEFLEFKNMLLLCELVIKSAISRQESRGAHFRVDFPSEKQNYNKHTVIDIDGEVNYED